MELGGLHHVTAVTGDAPRNLDFYTRVLGLRLVKKTVNQDDPTVYHLFFADEKGSAGSPAPRTGVLEEGDVGARTPALVRVEEVVDGRVVLVDRLLHEPQAEHPGVEVDVPRRVTGDQSDVMDAFEPPCNIHWGRTIDSAEE